MARGTRATGGSKGRKKAAAKRRARAKKADGAASAKTARPEPEPEPEPVEAGTGLPADGKLYYRIGEVAKITGVKPHVLRYWETEFRWMSPPKSRSRQRLYRRKDIEMIAVIKRLLYEERYTIAGARQRLRELGLAKAKSNGADESGAERTAGVAADGPPFARLRAELAQIREVLAEPII